MLSFKMIASLLAEAPELDAAPGYEGIVTYIDLVHILPSMLSVSRCQALVNANSIKIIVALFASYKLSDVWVRVASRILLFQVTRSLYAHEKTTEGVEKKILRHYYKVASMQSHQGVLTSKGPKPTVVQSKTTTTTAGQSAQ
jgi:hypothetical protein